VKIGSVLSEGEQRAVALALFLAECSFGRGRSAIVLDDPAALLDRERCEHVAGRLVEEAQRRQVIVFTHDLAFVQMLQRAAAGAEQPLHSQAIRRAFGRAGILSDVPASGETAQL
jgi:wobble nucleotide-excising tRNase